MGVMRLGPISRYWTLGQVSARSSMSYYRYRQVKRFLHISMPDDTAALTRKDWWRKLEPLSSHLRKQSQALVLPGTQLSIDEMMISFTGRSFHTVRIPSKPIPRGYKVIALCSMGYTIDWILTSRTESFAELVKLPDLSPTSSAVLQLCRSLDTRRYHFIIYMDNGFSTIPLFQKLRECKIGACGTTRVNRIGYPAALEEKVFMEWNTIDGCTVDGVLCFRWMDNNIVRMLTTVHPWNEVTRSLRRRPRSTSTNASMVRKAFAGCDRASFFIPTAIDDYNHYMGGVDIADQRRAGILHRIHNTTFTFINDMNTGYTTHQRALRNWLAFFYFFLDLSTTNAHILLNLARTSELNRLLDSGQLAEHDILSHPLARPIPAAEFRRMLFKQLGDRTLCTTGKGREGRARQIRYRPSTRYRSKTSRTYFTKHHTLQKPIVEAFSSHHLEKMEKRRECCICRYNFRTGKKGGRSRPKLTHFECRSCSPPSALCAGDRPCFASWHSLATIP